MWMELLTGNTLEAEIERRGPLPYREVAEIGLELCRALEAVGAAGLVHRDIKPANIVREPIGRVVLTDFGLGRRRAIPERETWRSSGTPVFMPPERLAGDPATPRSDIYALGVTLRWALTGRCPFRARTLDELKLEAEAGPSESLRAQCPDAPPALIAAIERAMAPKAESRFAGAAQLADALRPSLDTVGAAVDARARRRRIAYVAALVVFVASAALLAGSALIGRSTAPHPARFTIGPPPGMVFNQQDVLPIVSPDGRLLVYQVQDSVGVQRLWLRPLGSLQGRVLEGPRKALCHSGLPRAATSAFSPTRSSRRSQFPAARRKCCAPRPTHGAVPGARTM
jgi:serine/threonine protein kinase